MAASSSSSSKRRRSYDVFLSFRGTDVRNNFLGHLYKALDQRGINTYMDDEELSKGEEISSALMEAIEESQIAIVIFSKDYASSSWCLDELAKIMECKEQKHLKVFPLFYKVEPREVRTPRKSYRKAMAEHEIKFGEDSKKVNRWKNALLKVGSLSGWHFTDGYEDKLIEHIVREISTRVDQTPPYVAKYPVGLDSRVQEVTTILNLRSKDDVLMVGLWGQGGIGKTTLAKAIYGAVFREFQGSCFLERVRERSKISNDLVPLQKALLSEVLGKKFKVYGVAKGSSLIQDRLHNKKVFIILDDVDDACQLNALAGNCQWFGDGSRIIITTRYKQLLISHGISQDYMYEVKVLKDGEAGKLFRQHAFLGNQKIEIHSNLVDGILCYAGGLPLALVVLGSLLCGRGEREWESTLQKLSKIPDKKINDVLKVSYDGLEDYAKEIFLDIACFFKGQSTEYIKKVLDSCYDFDTTIGVKILIERSLIRRERSLIRGEHGILQMHDLIQSMGMDIVREKCRDDPEKCSRLWLHDDVLNVLSGDMGTNAIKAIVLKLPKPEEMHIGPNAFMNMKKLRLLILHNVHNFFQGPIHLPNELRWLEWPHCASIPEFGHGQKKLVGVDLRNTNIEVVMKQFQDYKKLKFVNFSECTSVVCIPDLYCTPCLVELDLHGCKNLEHLPDVLQSKNLQLLNLNDCSKLQRFPDIPNEMKGLRRLYLIGTAIEELPTSIENFVSLKEMDVRDCKKLEILPSSIYRLGNLEGFWLDGCSKLIHFPKKEESSSDPHTKTGFPKLKVLDLRRCNLSEVEFLENHSCFPSLERLNLSGNNFTNLPTCEQLYELRSLYVADCQGVQEILNIPGKLHELNASNCKSLSKIPSNICGVDCSADLYSCHELVRSGLTINDLLKPEHFRPFDKSFPPSGQVKKDFLLPGGEMPDWLVSNEEGYISFMASKELFKEKFIALAFCVVFREKEQQVLGSTLRYDKYMNGGSGIPGRVIARNRSFRVDRDHVWLWYSKDWNEGPNGWNEYALFIRASRRGIVKSCGFRLIFKPLGNDLEVLLQHNPLMDPDLLHEVRHYDGPTSTMEESSNEREDLLESKTSTEENSSSNLVLTGSNMADFSLQKHRYSLISAHYRNVRPGGEMPEEFVPIEDDTICFTASQVLYDKFLGLALCVVFGIEDGKREISFNIVPHVNNQRRNVLSGTLGSFDSDHVWFQYLKSNILWGLLEGGVDFGEFDERYLRFSLQLKVSGGTVKKLGYVIRCRQLEDDLKVVLEDNQLVNLASLCEDSQELEDLEIDPGFLTPREQRQTEYLRRCHLHREELEATDSETD